MAEITITVNDNEIAQIVTTLIAERMAKEYSAESRETKYGIRQGVEKSVKDYIYSQKDLIIEKCVARASAELARKGVPRLINTWGGKMTDIEKALVCYDGDNSKPYCDLVHRALKELQKRENPKPLTMEELKKRIGKPVWLENGGNSWWSIVNDHWESRHSNGLNRFHLADNETCFDINYGKTWIAYDYPPKEGKE